MASSNQTAHYDLNQWAGTDDFNRVDFNADNQKVDAALHTLSQAVDTLTVEKCRMVTGTYEGTGEVQTIQLDFAPKLVLVRMYKSSNWSASQVSHDFDAKIAVAGLTDSMLTIEVTATGFTLLTGSYLINGINSSYFYCAIG